MSDYRLEDVATVKVDFEGADFWIRRKGSVDDVGKPTKEYDPEYIGIKVTRTDVLVPEFLYYVFEYLHMNGEFRRLTKGALRLVHLTVDDIKNIKLVDK